jgi:hypothetical protein
MMPVKKYYFIIGLTPVRMAPRYSKAEENGPPAEMTSILVGTRVCNDGADACAPCFFYLLPGVKAPLATPDFQTKLAANIEQNRRHWRKSLPASLSIFVSCAPASLLCTT